MSFKQWQWQDLLLQEVKKQQHCLKRPELDVTFSDTPLEGNESEECDTNFFI